MSEGHIYTKEEFIAYGDRLHINTVIDIIVNGVSAYIVLKHSTKAMGIYKYYILLTIISSFFMDFHISFIFGPFIMLPSTIMCGSGTISRYFNVFWGQLFQYGLMNVTVSSVGWSIIYGMLYQYYSLQGNAYFFQTFRGIFILITFMIFYTSPALFLAYFFTDYAASAELVKVRYPNSYELYQTAPCFTVRMDAGGKAHYCVLVIQVLFAGAVAFFIAFKIHRKLLEMKGVLSKATLKARRQLLISLCLQLIVPYSLIIIPIGILLGSVLIDFKYMNVVSNYVMPIIAFHSLANSFTIMLVITPYRQTLKRWRNKIFHIKQISTSSIIAPPSSTMVTSSTEQKPRR